jgi:hypothetical protein
MSFPAAHRAKLHSTNPLERKHPVWTAAEDGTAAQSVLSI